MLTCFLIEAASRSIDAITLAGRGLRKAALQYLRWRADYELRRLATRALDDCEIHFEQMPWVLPFRPANSARPRDRLRGLGI